MEVGGLLSEKIGSSSTCGVDKVFHLSRKKDKLTTIVQLCAQRQSPDLSTWAAWKEGRDFCCHIDNESRKDPNVYDTWMEVCLKIGFSRHAEI